MAQGKGNSLLVDDKTLADRHKHQMVRSHATVTGAGSRVIGFLLMDYSVLS